MDTFELENIYGSQDYYRIKNTQYYVVLNQNPKSYLDEKLITWYLLVEDDILTLTFEQVFENLPEEAQTQIIFNLEIFRHVD